MEEEKGQRKRCIKCSVFLARASAKCFLASAGALFFVGTPNHHSGYLRAKDLLLEEVVQEEVFQVGVLVKSFLDVTEETATRWGES